MHWACLTNPVASIHGLKIHLRILMYEEKYSKLELAGK